MTASAVADFNAIRSVAAKELREIRNEGVLYRKTPMSILLKLNLYLLNKLGNLLLKKILMNLREHEVMFTGLSSKISMHRLNARHGDLGEDWSLDTLLNALLRAKARVKKFRSSFVQKIDSGRLDHFDKVLLEQILDAFANLYASIDELYVESLELEASIAPVNSFIASTAEQTKVFLNRIASE